MNLDAIVQRTTGKKKTKKTKKKKQGRNTGTVGKRVSFRTKDGKLVQFTPKKKGAGQKRKPSAYNLYVGRRIKQLTNRGYTHTDAMKQAAKEWKAGKR